MLNRRDFLVGGSILAGASIFSGCSKSQFEDKNINFNRNKKVKLKLATSWPDNFPIMGTGVTKFAERVREVSGGSIDIQVYGKNRLVPALAVFDTAFHQSKYIFQFL